MKQGLERQRYIQIFFILCGAALVLKAAQLQLFDSSYRERADATTIDKLRVFPPRGLIYDRNDKLIINNEAMYDLMVTFNQVDLKSMDIAKFCSLLGITEKRFYENLNKDFRSGKFSRSVPFVFEKKLSIATYARLQESLYEFPGFFVQVRNIRGYPYNAGAHVLGYINEADPRDIERSKGVYESGEYLGAAGLESRYESILKGKKGASSLLKDHLGRIVGKYKDGLFDTLATAGSDLQAAIDIELQAYGEKLMQGKTGSIVAIDPATGEILTMISMPTYNPNDLSMTQERGKVFSKILTDPLKPFFDRTVMAKYPPGSIFKTVVTLVGLEKGTLNPYRGQTCNGGYFYAGRLYKCHNHPHVNDAVDALANSCNAYYFEEFRNIVDMYGFSNPHQGLDTFTTYCDKFGLGRLLQVDYPHENAGNVPGSKFYDRVYRKELGGWRSPTIMSVGIGQGELQLTTLQMANLAACIANKGYWYPPHLARRFKDGSPIPAHFRKKEQTGIKREYYDIVQEGMSQCVIRGTARVAQVPGIDVCGKTGTSQNPHGEDHSVFFAFAPKQHPKIAIAVFVENAGWGASYAAPIASLMIEKYINDTIATARLPLQEKMINANLTDQYLAQLQKNKPVIAKPKPGPRRDTLPDPKEIPGNEPDVAPPPGSATTSTTNKAPRKK